MRNMSFCLTERQYVDGSKDITRRFGWWKLKPGDRVCAVRKAMGLKKGEKVYRLGIIEIISVRAELLDAITEDDCRREGFPHMAPHEFVKFLCGESGKAPKATVNRIEFRKVTA